MAVISLPLSFTNSFWTQDYRRGLEVLYTKLEQGVAENEEIIAFVRARAVAESNLALALSAAPPAPAGPMAGFAADDGASLLMTFRGLQAEGARQGDVHKNISHELHTLVADPFAQWAEGHRDRVNQSKTVMFSQYIRTYEQGQSDVAKLKNVYLSKIRKADEAEDDARFAPNSHSSPDKYTTSPRLGPLGPPEPENREHKTIPQRTPSVSERIAQRLKEIQKKSAAAAASATASTTDADSASKAETATLVSEPSDEKDKDEDTPSVDKGKGKAVDQDEKGGLPDSPPALSPPLPPVKKLAPAPLDAARANASSPMPPAPPSPIVLGSLSLPPSAISDLLKRAAEELPLRPIKFTLLGEYEGCFSGEEFVSWLVNNVQAFERSWDKAEDGARILAEEQGLLRRVGEFGNAFESADDAYYQFRPKAFELGTVQPRSAEAVLSPTKRNFAQTADNLLKKSGTFANLVSRAMTANSSNGEPPYVKARMEADDADHEYRVAVRRLDRQRLGLEERIEETLKTLQRWEADRLRAVKTVLLQLQGTLANEPKALEPSLKRSETLIAAFQPESDLNALIERYRTGPFRPTPQVYESVSHDEADVVFGIDLRKWAEGGWDGLQNPDPNRPQIPPVLKALLDAMIAAYKNISDDNERRKAWIYEVPLAAVHHLRETLNGHPMEQPIPAEMLAKYDPPVIASAIKLWMLELDPPLALYEGWDEIRKIYPGVGSAAKADDEEATKKRIEELQVALQRLPRVHLLVIDAVVQHLDKLIDLTDVEEEDEVFINKLALSLGRAMCRPKYETELSIQDRHPTLLFIDLLTNYEEILPPTIAKKKRESARQVPIRKRTAPIDMRMHRSRLSVSGNLQTQVAAQETAQKISPEPAVMKSVPPTPVQNGSTVANAPPPAPPAAAPAAPPPAAPSTDSGKPPVFKEPPPEDDDLPPRPTFKEPPPEHDGAPPRPKFKDPPPEDDFASAPSSPGPEPAALASPTGSATGPSLTASDDRVLATKTSLSRSGSGEGRSIVRGPRVKGQRGSVSSMVANLNKTTGSPASPTPGGGFARGHRTGPSVSKNNVA